MNCALLKCENSTHLSIEEEVTVLDLAAAPFVTVALEVASKRGPLEGFAHFMHIGRFCRYYIER